MFTLPPFVQFTATTASQVLGTTTRDVINLQVTNTMTNNSQIAYYLSRVDMPSIANSSFNNWNVPSQVITTFLTGSSIQIRPESFLNSTQLQKAGVTGPFRVALHKHHSSKRIWSTTKRSPGIYQHRHGTLSMRPSALRDRPHIT
jgi:hypothetical protein